MPEWGMVPIPTKLVKQGVRDMMRISDARMSGTSYGACVLHVSPESYIGGPLALVNNGDLITVDVPNRRIHLEVSDAELAARKAAWTPPPKRFERGYGHMFSQHILQADKGCDLITSKPRLARPCPSPHPPACWSACPPSLSQAPAWPSQTLRIVCPLHRAAPQM
jgi:dihydroxyacid dehydratase/phosphogluconate dehydratase